VVDRPPRLCQGCPHRDAYSALRDAVCEFADALVTSDIGCYTLGALPPYSAIESCVCMGASIGMAVGAAEAGFHPVTAVIGDSTFLHSGMTALADAVQRKAPITVVILDNSVIAMTGGQPTTLSTLGGSSLERVILGLGVDPDHFRVIQSHPRRREEITAAVLEEIRYRGLSVILLQRECVETARKRKTAPAGGAGREEP